MPSNGYFLQRTKRNTAGLRQRQRWLEVVGTAADTMHTAQPKQCRSSLTDYKQTDSNAAPDAHGRARRGT